MWQILMSRWRNSLKLAFFSLQKMLSFQTVFRQFVEHAEVSSLNKANELETKKKKLIFTETQSKVFVSYNYGMQ